MSIISAWQWRLNTKEKPITNIYPKDELLVLTILYHVQLAFAHREDCKNN